MARILIKGLAFAMSESTWGPSHRKLKAWQEAQVLAVLTYQTCAANRGAIDRGLADQIRRAAISIPSNIAEGNARGTNKDSLRFLYIARGSLCELESQVEVCLATQLLPQKEAERLNLQSALVGRLIGGLINYRRNRQNSTDGEDSP
jgi:four helix bundle protein